MPPARSKREKVGGPHCGTQGPIFRVMLHHVEDDDTAAWRQRIECLEELAILIFGPDGQEM